MSEKRHATHSECATPHVQRVVAVFSAVGDAKENVSGSERAPNVVAHCVQPKERAQRGCVEKRI